MPSSSFGTCTRAALFALVTLPVWACATAIDSGVESNSLSAGGDDGAGAAAGPGTASAGHGSSASAGSAAAGKANASAGASGALAQGGGSSDGGSSNGGSSNSAGKGGTLGAGGKTNSAGSGNAGKGGTSSGGGAGSSAGGSAGKGGSTSSAGASNTGGTTSSTTCDAAHSVATITTGMVYTGKANDCVRLAVNPTWSNIALQFQPMPGTAAYPVPFSFFSCGGNGTGSLTADYASVIFKNGANPGCDFFVQFGAGGTTVKVTYYD